MDLATCDKCGQTIIRWPMEAEWNHYGVQVDWELTDKMGCFCIAEPVKGPQVPQHQGERV